MEQTGLNITRKSSTALMKVALVGVLLGIPMGTRAQIVPGEWTGTAYFVGAIDFTVNDAGTLINDVVISIDHWHCSPFTLSGRVEAPPPSGWSGWPISNNRFYIGPVSVGSGLNSLTIRGEFSDAGDAVSGLWEYRIWTGSPPVPFSCWADWTGEPFVRLHLFDPGEGQHLWSLDRAMPVDSGFVFGTNYYGDQAKATAFALPAGKVEGEVMAVRVWFAYKRDGLTSQRYRLEILDGDAISGPIGEPLYSESFTLANVNADDDPGTPSQATEYILEPRVRVGASFFVSVDFGAYGQNDWPSAAIVATDWQGHRVPEVWEMWFDGSWHNLSDAWFGGSDGMFIWMEAQVAVGADAAQAPALSVKVFLQGPYSSGTMSTALNENGSLPLSQPYSDPSFDGTPLDYHGTETVASLGADVVDWVILELRSGTSGTTTVGQQAALLTSDGTIVGTDGSSPIEWSGLSDGDYYVVVRHRNHLAAMSSSAMTFTADLATSLDFTTSLTHAFGTSPMVALTGGGYGLWSSDSNADGQVTAPDFNAYFSATSAGTTGYVMTDFNMDAQVTAPDFNLYFANTTAGATSKVPED